MANHIITIENCKSYATEANLHKGLARLGLDEFTQGPDQTPCRYIVVCNAEGRYTAIFLATEFFHANKTGGYIGFAAYHGFMSV